MKSAARLGIRILAALAYTLICLHGKLHLFFHDVLRFGYARLRNLIGLHFGYKTVTLGFILIVIVLFIAVLKVFIYV